MQKDPQNRHPKKNLTDRMLKALQPAAPGQRGEVLDTNVPGLSVRVTARGRKTFVLRARFPGSKHFTRRALGAYGALSLAEAREKARKWLSGVSAGVDPALQEERDRQAALASQQATFGKVAKEYIAAAVIGPKLHDPIQRRGHATAREIRNDLISRWDNKPIADIDDVEVAAFLTEKRATPAHARNLFVALRCLFSWAIETRKYGLKASPCDQIKINKLIGDPAKRQRVLSDAELRAFWKSVDAMPYPEGPAYKLLALSGLRLNEVVRASWSEFDLPNKAWLIPKERMKGRKNKARAHFVPLTSDMLAILGKLPRFRDGDFVFSTTFGKKPVGLGDKAKKRLDAAMLKQLREAAKERGDDPARMKLTPWINHDLRHTIKTAMSGLKIQPVVSEAVLAHVQLGMAATYDHHSYADEKRNALEAWNGKLRAVVDPDAEPPVEPKPLNVVRLQANNAFR